MASCTSFMESALVLWVKTFAEDKSVDFQDLINGSFLNKVVQNIDSRPIYGNVSDSVEDMNSRTQNWDILIRNIKTFYQDVLQQVLITQLPNYHLICKDPEKDASLIELRKVLLLILGCAIQCDQKESFIEAIKSLDVNVQHEIVELIKEVTDDTEFIMHMEPTESLETYTEKMFNHVTRLIKERDDYFEILSELAQERDFYQGQLKGQTTLASPDKHHMVVELADCKAKVRKLRQELEDKQELISDLQVEIEENRNDLSKTKTENKTLLQDARSARLLRDELDVLREKVAVSNSYQAELNKCKERLNELEFYKSRVNELREDNAIITETKNILEEQLSASHKRMETVAELENDLLQYRQQVEEMTLERDADREKIKILTEENAQLLFEKKSNMNESTNLEQELESARLKIAGIGGNLSDQMVETTNAKIIRLELENQRLKKNIEEIQSSTMIENSALHLELEKENQRLAKKIEKLHTTSSETSQQLIELEENLDRAAREKDNLTQTLDTMKENYERQVRELEAENDNLQQTVKVIRERNEQTNDTRLKELERENKKLHETLSQKNHVTSKLEYENIQMQKSFSKLKLNSDHISELETENKQFEKENCELRKTLATLQLTCDKSDALEQQLSDLEVENRKLQKNLKSCQSGLQRKDALEQENINLTVENKKLERSLHSMKNASSRIAELESEKDALNRQLQQCKKSLESQKKQRSQQEQMELDLLDLDNENQRLQQSLEVTTNRLNQLEKDNTEIEVENERLQKTIQEMSSKRLHDVQKETSQLETELNKMQTSKAVLEKENKRLKQSVQFKDTSVDELTTKYNILEKEHRSLKRTVDSYKESSAKLHELERENREILQQSNVDKKTISTLREDLVNEKIHCQQMNNELEKLNAELERVGINKEKLLMAEQAQDDNRYKALENMMEEAFKKNMEIKEDKILSLQSRLDESKNRNVRLQEELRILRRETESLKQRYEEENTGDRHGTKVSYHGPLGIPRTPPLSQNSPTKDILEIKDHLITVERTNATLLTENKNMKVQTDLLNQQIQKLDSHNAQLQSQSSSVQEQNTSLQSQNARLQVEMSTLQAQCSSLQSHCQSLQNQLNRMESEHQHLIQTHEELQSTHEQLVTDHEDLQRLHEQLSSDHEDLISQHGSLKSLHKSLLSENQALKVQSNHDQHQDSLRLEYNHMKEKHDIVYNQHEKIRKDYLDLSKEHKQLKTDYNVLHNSCDEYKNQLHQMDLEISNLGHRYDSLFQVNQKMEEDNKNLLMQVQALLNTNSDLLTQILSSKDTHAEEQKSYLEKLGDLKRQKERLEEKIMEAYKRQETQKKNKGLGARIARKAAKIFVSKNQRSKSRNNLTDLSSDNTSHGDLSQNGDSGRKSVGNNQCHGEDLRLISQGHYNKCHGENLPLIPGGPYNKCHVDGLSLIPPGPSTDCRAGDLRLIPRGPYITVPMKRTTEQNITSDTTSTEETSIDTETSIKSLESSQPSTARSEPYSVDSNLKKREISNTKHVMFPANVSVMNEPSNCLNDNSTSQLTVGPQSLDAPPNKILPTCSNVILNEDGSEDNQQTYDLKRRSSAGNLLETSSQQQSALHMLSGDGALRGTKSTEDLLAAGSTSLLPGLGHPAVFSDDDDDDGGFGKRNSPSNEMLTLEQFLLEGSKTSTVSPVSRSASRDDLDSKSSENSDNSANRRRRQAPMPPTNKHASIPDVVSQSQLNLSRISAGSSGSGSKPEEHQSTPPKRDQPETSTPAYVNLKNDAPSLNFRNKSLGSTPSTASRTLQYTYPTPFKSPQNRELPPTPNDRLSGYSPASNSDRSSSLYNNQDNSVQYDASIRSGQNSQYRSPGQWRSPQVNGQVTRGQSLNRPQTYHEQNSIYLSIDENKHGENRPENHYARVQRIERPKSVPPNMFEAQQENTGAKDNMGKGTPPKPPPRKTRDGITSGRLLREPGNSRGRQLPQGELLRSSTPTLRKETPPRQSTEDPPKNSIWR